MLRFLLLCLVIFTGVTARADQPNIILIMADDVGWEAFGCYGGEDYRTPHIDALAASGTRFRHCYSTPICTTSRVKLMTGQYNFRNYTHFGYLRPGEKTFAHLLKAAGYRTAVAGKWQLNGLYNRLPGYDDRTRPQQAGFDESLLWQVTTGKRPRDGGGERFWSPVLEYNGEFLTAEDNADRYGPDLMCNFICDFIDRSEENPFFVYYPMMLVHDPFVPTPETIGDAIRTQAANRQPKSTAVRKQNFVAMVEYMDRIVGRIVKKVQDAGQEQNTLILFTADNGTNTGIVSRWDGQDIRGGKAGMKDMGTHVPLVAAWPGTMPSGVVLDDLIDFTDFYPTLAEVAGVSLTKDDPTDGRSFLPQLQGQPGHPRDWVLCHYQPYWRKQPGQFARTQRFKLYRDGRLYDVPSDLKEEHDLAAGSRHTPVHSMLQTLLDRCPPAPIEVGSRDSVYRPTYAGWPNVLEPGD